MLKTLANRFKEPSSWAGLGAIVAGVGFSVDPGIMQSADLILAGLCGIASIVIPEGK